MIRKMTFDDFKSIWRYCQPSVCINPSDNIANNLSIEQAFILWNGPLIKAYSTFRSKKLKGVYFCQIPEKNKKDFLCKCWYIVCERERYDESLNELCNHSFKVAKKHGATSIQTKCVISIGNRAINIFKSFGFNIVGVYPVSYKHRVYGYQDCFILVKQLEKEI